MDVPRHWVRVEGTERTPDGKPRHIMVWGWSSRDRADAESVGRRRFEELVARVRAGLGLPERGYAYGSRPLREEIVQELPGDREPSALVTRNRYGALVLNASRTLFLDVDEPPPSLASRLKRLFGRPPATANGILAHLRSVLAQDKGSYRVYRTAGGYRVLGTDAERDPDSTDTARLMEATGTDTSFINLCRAQHSFRARLTPKPWRCRLPLPPGMYPREAPHIQERFADWLTDYERTCSAYATCRFLDRIGDEYVHDRIAPILELHDRATRANEALPLA
jgi:hypothetical protein